MKTKASLSKYFIFGFDEIYIQKMFKRNKFHINVSCEYSQIGIRCDQPQFSLPLLKLLPVVDILKSFRYK